MTDLVREGDFFYVGKEWKFSKYYNDIENSLYYVFEIENMFYIYKDRDRNETQQEKR